MVELTQYKSLMKFPEYDYIFDKPDKVLEIMSVLTPKFNGSWEIILLDPTIVFAKQILSEGVVPDFINCRVYLSKQKMSQLLIDVPSLTPKKQSNWDIYMTMIGSMTHLIEDRAASDLYNAFYGNLDHLQEALNKLDAECESGKITVSDVRKNYLIQNTITARQLLAAFLKKDRYRWKKYDTYVKSLGINIAYYALRKHVKILLHDKSKYLSNQECDNKLAQTVDAPLICYVYFLFSNSTDPLQLPSILSDIDTRTQECVDRRLMC